MESNDENSDSGSETMFLECEEAEIGEIVNGEDTENFRPVVNLVQPYMYEPEADEDGDDQGEELPDQVRTNRMQSLDW